MDDEMMKMLLYAVVATIGATRITRYARTWCLSGGARAVSMRYGAQHVTDY